MTVILCPGIHDPRLTVLFWNAIQHQYRQDHGVAKLMSEVYTVPNADRWGFSPIHVLQSLHQWVPKTQSVQLIGFSAGVVGAMGAAWAWQQQGGTVSSFIALDGWGVPLYGSFPIYRLSHDGFTHWSSYGLGMGQNPFYADPGVSHLDLWRSPDQAWGWWQVEPKPIRATAAEVIGQILESHST